MIKILIFIILGSLNLYSFNLYGETDSSCVRASGAVDVDASDGNNLVTDVEGNTGISCKEIPDFYKIIIYKFALCTANPRVSASSTITDFSSCSYFINNDSGVEHVISFPSSSSLAIESLPATNIYPYAILVLNNGLQLQHTEEFDINIRGYEVDGGTAAGKFCWTNSQKTAYSGHMDNRSVVTTDNSDTSTLAMTCGTQANAAPVYTTEYIDSFGGGDEDWVGDNDTGFDLNGGIMKARLLQSDYTNITSGTNTAKANLVERLLAVIEFTNSQSVTSDTSYSVNFKIQKSVSVDLSGDDTNVWAMKNGADPFQIYIDFN